MQQLIDEREKSKVNGEETAPMCKNILQFGCCSKYTKCQNRHVFMDSDKPVNIPIDGLVKFDLIEVHNAAHYCIKVLQYLPSDENRWISCEKRNLKVEEALERMQNVMRENEPVSQLGVKSGDICAVFSPKLHKWCRARVSRTQ